MFIVKAQKTEGGATFAYGYDLADRVTSISQSTKAGESSSIQRVYDEKGLLIKLISGNTVIEYTYDDKRRIKSIKLNGESNRTFTYQNEGKRVMDYHAIGLAITTEKDDLGNVISVTRGSAEVERYTYNKGLVKEATKNGMPLRYTYDSKKRVTQISTLGDVSSYSYDLDGNLSEHVRRGETTTYEYSTDSKKSLKKVTKGDLTTSLKTDLYGRNTGKEITNSSNAKIYGEEISYLKKGDHATNIPNVIKYYDAQLGGYGQELKYSYDANGNICQITEEGKLLAKYTYDGLNRLIREDNARLGKTYLLEYDSAGNVISKRVCAFTLDKVDKITVFETEDVFTYNGDLLMSKNTQKCAYTRGRPTKYLDQTVSYKQLGLIKSYNGVTYQYDNSGNRISKGDITFTNDRDGKAISQSNGISFIFDHNEEIIGIKNGDVPYYFRKNLQGDVICLLDNVGNVVVRCSKRAPKNNCVARIFGKRKNCGKVKHFIKCKEFVRTNCNSILLFVWILRGVLVKVLFNIVLILLSLFCVGCDSEVCHWVFNQEKTQIEAIYIVEAESPYQYEIIRELSPISYDIFMDDIKNLEYKRYRYNLHTTNGLCFVVMYKNGEYDIISYYEPQHVVVVGINEESGSRRYDGKISWLKCEKSIFDSLIDKYNV